MAHPFELSEEITLDATPAQVWAAISTGPGVDSWLMGHNEFGDHVGAENSMTLMGFTSTSTITTWEEGKHLAFRSDEADDGTFMAFEYLVEGRAGGSTVLRYVHSGMLGDNWEAEYDGLRMGTPMYLAKLATYLRYFSGRTTTWTMFLPGPQIADADAAWSRFLGAFNVTGADARVNVDGLPPTEGTVDFSVEPIYIGIRTADGIYSLIHGYDGTIVVEYHDFSAAPDMVNIEAAWKNWLATAFTGASA